MNKLIRHPIFSSTQYPAEFAGVKFPDGFDPAEGGLPLLPPVEASAEDDDSDSDEFEESAKSLVKAYVEFSNAVKADADEMPNNDYNHPEYVSMTESSPKETRSTRYDNRRGFGFHNKPSK